MLDIQRPRAHNNVPNIPWWDRGSALEAEVLELVAKESVLAV